MAIAKLVFLGVMTICAGICLAVPLFVPEQKNKKDPSRRLRIIVKTRMICFIVFLVMLLLCVIL